MRIDTFLIRTSGNSENIRMLLRCEEKIKLVKKKNAAHMRMNNDHALLNDGFITALTCRPSERFYQQIIFLCPESVLKYGVTAVLRRKAFNQTYPALKARMAQLRCATALHRSVV